MIAVTHYYPVVSKLNVNLWDNSDITVNEFDNSNITVKEFDYYKGG